MGKLIFDQTEPSNGLFNAVWGKIEKEKIKNAKKQALFSGVVSIFSLVSIIGTGEYLATEFYRTGFYDYASLFVSDWNSIAFFWKEAMVSIGESLPVTGLFILFVTSAVFLFSLKNIIKNTLDINSFKIKTI